MKDLYRRLGLDGDTCSASAIWFAKENCAEPTTRSEAQHVLLDSRRRQVYDRNRRNLVRIGTLRANLGLNKGEYWQQSACRDFTYAISQTQSELERLALEHSRTESTPRTKRRAAIAVVAVLGVLGAIALIDSLSDSSGRAKKRPAKPKFNEPVLPLPAPGAMALHYSTLDALGRGVTLAPLEIATRHSDGRHYYVKVVDCSTGRTVLSAFVRGGERCRVEVPLGSYEIKYAAGRHWYGERHHFGPDTAYAKAAQPFHFIVEDGYVRGYTIELLLRPQGTLRTTTIRAEDF